MKRRHYVRPIRYTDSELERWRVADLLNDARQAMRCVREIRAGADASKYGCTIAEYESEAARAQEEWRKWRAARLANKAEA